jgi:hypothetical protein
MVRSSLSRFLQPGNSQFDAESSDPVVKGQHLTIPTLKKNTYVVVANTATVGGTPQTITTEGDSFKLCPNDDGNPYNSAKVSITLIATANRNFLSGLIHLVYRF